MLTGTRLMTTVAALALAPVAVFAESHGGDSAMDEMQDGGMYSGTVSVEQMDNMLRSSNIIGGNVYTLSTDPDADMEHWEAGEAYETLDDDWERIGDIDDIVLSMDGRLTGVVVEGGGFLDIGDDDVLIEMRDLRLIRNGADDYNWVTNISQEQFEDMPEVEDNWF